MDRVALLPYTKVVRKRTKLPPPVTIGEHIKQARLAQGLYQAQAAELIGVTETTVIHWEKGHTEPQLWAWPAIVNFLGYDPTPAPTNLPERTCLPAASWVVHQSGRRSGSRKEPGSSGSRLGRWRGSGTGRGLKHF